MASPAGVSPTAAAPPHVLVFVGCFLVGCVLCVCVCLCVFVFVCVCVCVFVVMFVCVCLFFVCLFVENRMQRCSPHQGIRESTSLVRESRPAGRATLQQKLVECDECGHTRAVHKYWARVRRRCCGRLREHASVSDSVHRQSVGHPCYTTETSTHSANCAEDADFTVQFLGRQLTRPLFFNDRRRAWFSQY